MPAVLRLMPGDPTSGGSSSAGPGRAKPGNGPQRPSTILVVEDEILIRIAASDFLREAGYRVLEAANAAEAQVILTAEEPIEVVFSDVNMPGAMNGIELAKWIREKYPDVKVILTSGVKAVARSAAAAVDEGHFLQKPYSHQALAAYIRKLLGPA